MNILSTPVDEGGCGFYRIRQPFKKINKNTESEAIIMAENQPGDKIIPQIKDADVIVLRPRSEILYWQLKEYLDTDSPNIELLNLKNKRYILDHDDNTFEVSPLSMHYDELGTEEVETVIDGKKVKLWQDGVANFDLKRNREWAKSLMKILKEVDLVTVTTPKLAEYYSQFNKNVKVLPNCIDFDRFKPLNLVKDEWIRIGWSGGVSHYIDWTTISEPLAKIFEKYPNVKLVISGSHFPGALKGVPEDRIEYHPWVESVAHPYHLATLNIDIAIIPLRDVSFNHYKSEIKYSEFSALKIPSLVANILPYSAVVEDGKNALAYSSDEEFTEKLVRLIEDENLRKELAENAYNWVKENRDADKMAHLWTEAYK